MSKNFVLLFVIIHAKSDDFSYRIEGGETMQFKEFIKEKIPSLVFLFIGILTIEIFLMIYPFGNFVKWYIPICVSSVYFIGIGIEYATKRNFYAYYLQMLNELEKPYLITEIIQSPSFIEGKILKHSLEQINKSMLEHVNTYKHLQEEYKEYIELWIHEVKIPIATSKMIIENNKDAVTKSIYEELDKVENYTEQALFYARSNTVEKDYYIKQHSLKEMVNESIKKNKNVLIQTKIAVHIHDIDVEVFTDSKWLVFMLNQVIQNSSKYKKQEGMAEIEIYAKKGKENVTLYVKDNGIGIPSGEIGRVLEKGFTGTNGRIAGKKSTGMGLYICKKLCDKLGMGIELRSVEQEGTEVRFVFPQGSYIHME